MAGLGDLLSNKLFLQYLNAAGQDISSGNPIGTNVNNVTNQAISAKNYKTQQNDFLGMLQQILSGKDVPDGMKATVDKTGMKLNIPGDIFKNAVEGAKLSGLSGIDFNKPENNGLLKILNPFR